MIANGLERAGAESLLQRLENPQTVEALHRLLDRADLIAFAAEAVDSAIRRGETITDSVAESVKDFRRMTASGEPLAELAGHLPQLAAAGGKFAELTTTPAFRNLAQSGLLERLGQPSTIQQIHNLLDRLEVAGFAMQMLEDFLRRSEQVLDNVAGLIGEARKTGNIKPEDLNTLKETASGVLNAAKYMQQSGALAELPKLTDTLVQLLKSGVFSISNLNVVAEVGNAASASYLKAKAAPLEPIGAMGLWKALGDPDVQRALGFMVGFAKQYGQTIR